MVVLMETIGERARREMEQRRMTGRSLAVAVDKDQSYVSKLINDRLKETPPPEVLAGLERVLGIPVGWSLCALGYAIEDAELDRHRAIVESGVTAYGLSTNARHLVELSDRLTDEEVDALVVMIAAFLRGRP